MIGSSCRYGRFFKATRVPSGIRRREPRRGTPAPAIVARLTRASHGAGFTKFTPD
jgi:hypothetical protein